MSKQQKRNVSIYDISEKTGYSVATVSRVLSGSDYPVNAQTKAQILDCAHAFNYVHRSRKAITRSTPIEIGVILPTCVNPWYSQIAQGIVLAAQNDNMRACFCYSSRNAEQEKEYVKVLLQKKVRGLIVSTSMKDLSYWEALAEKGVPVVLVDQNSKVSKCSRVTVDQTKSAIMAVDYLVNMGHRKIALISTPLTKLTRKEVYHGYKMGILHNELEWRGDYVIVLQEDETDSYENFEFESGRKLAQMCLQLPDRPTALLAVNDMTAIGAIQYLVNEAALRVPKDMSIIGIDNIEMAKVMNPPLTTVSLPSIEIGQMAVRLLSDSISRKDGCSFSLSMEPELVIRGSVKECKPQEIFKEVVHYGNDY
ncbi:MULTISPECIES: LacI family DNA-binding transcriptional regulator [Anaerotruncus]|jgi:LacI family transcriptional regulator|uniref:LacI family DNA-binding transcriptional regulator n=1 Tax=Anaerotruncus TaxID=244127 RepID=UPI00082E89AD|nr:MULTISPECIES: LacI family DNA-binding transcriptional regulator [Anaerotruncus]